MRGAMLLWPLQQCDAYRVSTCLCDLGSQAVVYSWFSVCSPEGGARKLSLLPS